MHILITAATNEELNELSTIKSEKHHVDFAVTGIGMVSTAYHLTKALAEKQYDLVINGGIAGSFDRSIAIGEVVYVEQDMFSELGAEENDQFLSLAAMGLTGEDTFSPKAFEQFPILNKLKKVRAITVNTVHGNEKNIQRIVERLHPEIETMEGAAFYFVCEKENVPAIQLRAVSNYVEKRNKESWNIPLAIRSLYESIYQFIHLV